MGVPSMVGFAVANIYDIVDMYWVSQLGPQPVAAITIFSSFMWVVFSGNQIVGTGSVAIISRRYGEKDYAQAELSIKETILLKWIMALIFGVIGFFITPAMLDLLGAEGEVLDIGITYGRIIFIGLGFNFATYSVFTALRGVANPNMAMILMLSFTVLNIVLDPFLIFGWWIFPEMGVAGAAIASVISYVFAFTTGMIVLFSGMANIKIHLRSEGRIRISTMWQILKIGTPSAIGELSFSLSRMVIMPMIAVFGTGVVAAYGVGNRITHFGIMLLVGIGLGLSALIGQTVGSHKLDRAKHTANQAILLGIGIMSVMGVVTYFFAEFIMRQFFERADIIGYGVTLLRILAVGFPFIGLYLMTEMIYSGVGENRPAMITTIIYAWVLQVPAIFVTTRLFNLNQQAIWWSITFASIVSAIGFYLYFKRGKWLSVKV
jgi:putative MATE family efflux protein